MKSVKNSILFEFKIIKEYWQISSIIGTILVFLIYYIIENRESIQEVEELTKSNKNLVDRVSRLEGEIEVLNNMISIFAENNPKMNSRIEGLEKSMSGSDNKNNKVELVRIIEQYPRDISIDRGKTFLGPKPESGTNTAPIVAPNESQTKEKKTPFRIFGKKKK
jgi:predicted nuclease with TOPRIM domain